MFNSLLNLEDRGHWDGATEIDICLRILYDDSSSSVFLTKTIDFKMNAGVECCHVCGQVWQRRDGEFLQDFSNSLKECRPGSALQMVSVAL